jgi:hypothetical protein
MFDALYMYCTRSTHVLDILIKVCFQISLGFLFIVEYSKNKRQVVHLNLGEKYYISYTVNSANKN